MDKINKLRNMRIELDKMTTDCFQNKYPSHISNHFCTVLSLLDENITELWKFNQRSVNMDKKKMPIGTMVGSMKLVAYKDGNPIFKPTNPKTLNMIKSLNVKSKGA